MNTYTKFAANVFVAKCDEAHEKGEVITVTSRYGKDTDVIVYNLVKELDGCYFYSFVRDDGENSQTIAERKAERLKGYQANAQKRSNEYLAAAQEGRKFLALGESIKIGHHSEKRHRKLFERNAQRMDRACEEMDKAESYNGRIAYWEKMAGKIDLSMPESLDYFSFELEKAKNHHQELKNNPEKRLHNYSLTYAKKAVNDLEKKVNLAQILWG